MQQTLDMGVLKRGTGKEKRRIAFKLKVRKEARERWNGRKGGPQEKLELLKKKKKRFLQEREKDMRSNPHLQKKERGV